MGGGGEVREEVKRKGKQNKTKQNKGKERKEKKSNAPPLPTTPYFAHSFSSFASVPLWKRPLPRSPYFYSIVERVDRIVREVLDAGAKPEI